eukprot:766944-Hanusia_phi.AAC.1
MALSETSGEIIHLEETLSYLHESLEELHVPELPQDVKSKRLYRVFNCSAKCEVIKASVYDLGKLIAGAANQLENLQQVSDVINTKQLERLYFEVENNTQMLVDSGAAFERSGAALSVMNVVLAGSFAFSLLDRLSTTWVNASPPVWFTIYVIQPFVNPPGVFFCANLVWVSVFCYALIRYMRYITSKASGVLNIRVTVNKRIKSMVQLDLYLKNKQVKMVDAATEPTASVKKITFKETDSLKARSRFKLSLFASYFFSSSHPSPHLSSPLPWSPLLPSPLLSSPLLWSPLL